MNGLQVNQLHAFYGKSHVLRGIDLSVAPGEIVAVLGRNGSGRSTLARALVGQLPCSGSVVWNGQALSGRKAFDIAQLGVGYLPESRDIFPTLSAHQNLLLGLKKNTPSSEALFQKIYGLFPKLQERQHALGASLSGGEQQMLALGRTLMGQPQLLVADEPSEGLAPQMVKTIAKVLQDLAQSGVAIVLMEQKLALALQIAHRAVVIGHGQIVFDGTPQALAARPAICQEWLGV
ncbi:MAG: ABC transporter ATP-binding protein [Comamonadaceae bacterium]